MTTMGYATHRLKLAFMRDDRAVLLATIIGATLVALGVLGLIAAAIWTGHGTDALIAGGAAIILAYVNQSMGSLHSKIDDVANRQASPSAIPPAEPRG